MGKSLVIVESPAKAKTINKYLGKDFIVKSSVGHIRDLPTAGSVKKTIDQKSRVKAASATRKLSCEQKVIRKQQKAKAQLIERMGIDPDNEWKARYEVLPGKKKVVDELRRLADTANTIYLATDLDREGEAIAWHLQEAIGGEPDRYRRVVFNEITKNAIQTAFKEPCMLNIDRVNAQQARRFLDRVVGYMLSPLLWTKIARGLSAGRVQSVAVKLIVERERDIRNFLPKEYWKVYADLTTLSGDTIRFQVVKQSGSVFKLTNKASTDLILAKLYQADYSLSDREDKLTLSKPSEPFITSTLQQTASTSLGFSVKKTMLIAQLLYEAGHITYMRTDSANLSNDAIKDAREYIDQQFGAQYLPETANNYSNKKCTQEAHEAIRPSSVIAEPGSISGLKQDAEKLYELIWLQFVACQMTAAKYMITTLVVRVDEFDLKAKWRILKFDGYTRIMAAAKKNEDFILPALEKGAPLDLKVLDSKKFFTKPPARFSEAALVKELEKRDIGRPSTYTSIISTIQDRGYVSLKNRRFHAEKIGEIVTDRLIESFHDLMDCNFTANMEADLDLVAEGGKQWKMLLDNFYNDFSCKLEKAKNNHLGMRSNDPSPTDIQCPECSRDMMIRTASTGVFLSCSGHALPPKERCKSTINLMPGEEVESNTLQALHHCPKCSMFMASYLIDTRRKIHVCGNNPDCPGCEVEDGQFQLKGYNGPMLQCDKCNTEMQLKTGRFGKYFSCANSQCKNTRKLLKNGEAAPPKMNPVPMPELQCVTVNDYYILRDGISGLFLTASQFPKHKEIRAPLVSELIPHQAAIDSKYHYLLDAPSEDLAGNPAVIRYSRKTKIQYVMSEVKGQATGWSAIFQEGKWQVKIMKKRKKNSDCIL